MMALQVSKILEEEDFQVKKPFAVESAKLFLRNAFLATAVGLISVGCVEQSIDRYVLDRPPVVQQNPVHQKKYANPSMEWGKFNELLEMAVYRGAPTEYGDLVMRGRSEKKGMAPVAFSHRTHRMNYTCRVCHLELEFSMKKGETDITREDYLNGRFCGACHNGQIAFSATQACNLCHVSENKGAMSSASAQYEMAVSGLPKTEYGDLVNWGEAIATGIINPKNTLETEQPVKMMPLPSHLEKPLRWSTNKPGVVVSFPHKAHIAWLDCANCHPDIFEIKNMGTVAFDKEKNLYGLYCGTCHMTVAFPMNGCSRCHPGHKDYGSSGPRSKKTQP